MSKRAETPALLDSGATENFINHQYATHLRLPTKRLERARKVYNVNGTLNKKGDILFYTDLEVRTGQKYTLQATQILYLLGLTLPHRH
jgi:hypothetical protein